MAGETVDVTEAELRGGTKFTAIFENKASIISTSSLRSI